VVEGNIQDGSFEKNEIWEAQGSEVPEGGVCWRGGEDAGFVVDVG
jgi:hypothetical protein